MTGCPHNAKNTLDKNYLYLAEKRGAEVLAEKKAYRITDIKKHKGTDGYEVYLKDSFGFIRSRNSLTASNVILAGGVLGTVRLLLDLKRRWLTDLSEMVGRDIRTNN